MSRLAIICVDDEPVVLQGLNAQLGRRFGKDYAVELAESGAEALDLIEDLTDDGYRIPVVITDQIMPGMKGSELLGRIAELLPDTRSILLTGQANADDVGAAVNQGNLYRYLAKPWEREDLILTVQEALKSHDRDRRLEEQHAQLQALNERLQRLDELKDQFLANTSHELRTPLQGIIGLAEALVDRCSEPRTRDDLSLIVSSSKRLSSLVNDLLDFSMLKNAELRLAPKPVGLRGLVDVVLKNHVPLVGKKQLELRNAVPDDLPAVLADEERLQQILYNLTGNAVKFTESGHVAIGAARDGDRVRIHVEDTGIGVPVDRQEAIFRDFEQADGSISRTHGGTGLGLSISRRLVELHGGAIGVESTPGRGATFYFTLPVSEEPARPKLPADAPAPARTDEAPGDARPDALPPDEAFDDEAFDDEAFDDEAFDDEAFDDEAFDDEEALVHVLVVDDEPINQQVLKHHLAAARYRISQAFDGTEALRLIHSEARFDLVLLDVMMPRMSGYEVCQRIRERYLPSELPIIMVTARSRVQDLVQGLSLGANDYLAKPFSKDEFLARVKTHLDLHRINTSTGKFVPAAFLRYLGRERITDVRLGDQTEQEVTILFLDIRDYTSLAETMSPAETFRFVNAFHGRMGPVIQRHRGFVHQFLGDAIMAIFPRTPLDALLAAVDLQETLRHYNRERAGKGRQPIRIGTGLHTGPLIMGIIGDEHRMDTATIADTVNTASRIEGLTKHYGASILLSEDSMNDLESPDTFHFRYLGQVLVKGKQEPIGLYECFSGDPPELLERKHATLPAFETGLRLFFAGDFPEAASSFSQVLKANPDDEAARRFLNKAGRYTYEGVPENWDGVEVMLFK